MIRHLWYRVRPYRRVTVIDDFDRFEWDPQPGSPFGFSFHVTRKHEVIRCRRRLWPLIRGRLW